MSNQFVVTVVLLILACGLFLLLVFGLGGTAERIAQLALAVVVIILFQLWRRMQRAQG